MAVELASAYVSIIPSAKGIASGLASELGAPLTQAGKDAGDETSKSFGKSFNTGLKTVAKASAVAFGAAVVGGVAFAKGAVDAASDLTESTNAVNVSFGDAAAGVLRISDGAAKSLGLSKSEFNGLAVQFQNFAQTAAGPGGDVVDTLDDLTTRAADFASVMNLDVAEAAGLFQSGLAGETEPLRKYGLDLSAAAVNAFAMANGIGESGKELTEAQKVQARYGLLMEKTSKTQGDFANTSDGLANQQRILKASFENSKAAIGTALLPALAAIMPVVQQAAEWLGENLPGAIDTMKAGITVAFEWIKVNVVPVFQAIADWVIEHWPQISATVTQAMNDIRSIIELVLTIIQVAWDVFGTYVLDAIVVLFDYIKATIQGAMDVIQGIIDLVMGIITGDWSRAWDGIKGILTGVWEGISALVDLALGALGILLDMAWDGIKTAASEAWEGVKSAITGIWDSIADHIDAVWETIKTTVSDGIGAVVDFITGIPGKVADALGNGFNALWDNFKAVINLIIDGINSVKLGSITIGGWDTHIPGVGKLPSFSTPPIDPFPHVDRLHGGGPVGGSGEVPILAMGGEMVLTGAQQAQLFSMANGSLAGSARSVVYAPTIISADHMVGKLFIDSVKQYERFNGDGWRN